MQATRLFTPSLRRFNLRTVTVCSSRTLGLYRLDLAIVISPAAGPLNFEKRIRGASSCLCPSKKQCKSRPLRRQDSTFQEKAIFPQPSGLTQFPPLLPNCATSSIKPSKRHSRL